MLIKFVEKNQVDVFTGIGWSNWSRFERQGKYLKLIKGKPLSKEDYSSVRKQLSYDA